MGEFYTFWVEIYLNQGIFLLVFGSDGGSTDLSVNPLELVLDSATAVVEPILIGGEPGYRLTLPISTATAQTADGLTGSIRPTVAIFEAVAIVPEPSSFALLALRALALGIARRRVPRGVCRQ